MTLSVHPPVSQVCCHSLHFFNCEIVTMWLSNSSCPEKTARTAPSIAFPATGVSTQIRHRTRPWHLLSLRALLPHPHLSHFQASRPRTLQQTEPSRGNQTRLRSGPSPGACMKVGVSILFLVAVG